MLLFDVFVSALRWFFYLHCLYYCLFVHKLVFTDLCGLIQIHKETNSKISNRRLIYDEVFLIYAHYFVLNELA